MMAKEKRVKEKESNSYELFKDTLKVLTSIGMGFFYGIADLAWAFAGFFILIHLMNYYQADFSTISYLLKMTRSVLINWGYFFILIWCYRSYVVFKDVRDE
jgi:hypothetical protein